MGHSEEQIDISHITLETFPHSIVKLKHIDKTNFSTFFPQFNVVNSAETTFSNLPRLKFNMELGEWRLKKSNTILQ